ncbi:unnamed protein product [Spirodela intermedia]|uniref:K-box domain-containing protein n=1 Tax=Spirodela intermedia TaxID=51605 RepID=A0A7I8IHH5_SPIIN|nr:unnamed protein product [Spirodela intermedia]CAA6657335.1 unnamed protein product [Spirodela intermedia]
MERILQRYERYSCTQRDHAAADPEVQETWLLEYGKQKAKIECLLKNQRHLMGEDLDNLKLKDLQQLELQLEGGLKEIRSRKSVLLFDSIAELQRKEKTLEEQNNVLQNMSSSRRRRAWSLAWPRGLTGGCIPSTTQNQSATSGSSSPPSFSLGDTLPDLPPPRGRGEPAAPRVGNTLPPWMISHLNAS